MQFQFPLYLSKQQRYTSYRRNLIQTKPYTTIIKRSSRQKFRSTLQYFGARTITVNRKLVYHPYIYSSNLREAITSRKISRPREVGRGVSQPAAASAAVGRYPAEARKTSHISLSHNYECSVYIYIPIAKAELAEEEEAMFAVGGGRETFAPPCCSRATRWPSSRGLCQQQQQLSSPAAVTSSSSQNSSDQKHHSSTAAAATQQ